MPLIGFKKRFSAAVKSGEKRQTIRAKRADGRNPHPGDRLHLYTGLRTKSCVKLGEAICTSVEEISIDMHGINLSGRWLLVAERQEMARADGFDCFQCMLDFFEREHGFPFDGLLIRW